MSKLLPTLLALSLALSVALADDSPGAVLRVSIVDEESQPYRLGKLWVNRTAPLDPQFTQWLPIGPNGLLSIALPPGDYEARWDTRDSIRPHRVMLNGELVPRYGKLVRVDGYGIQQVLATFTVVNEDVNLTFVVPNLESNRLKGVVTDANGAPIKNLRFDLYRGDAMNCARCAVTDETGRFAFACRKFPIKLVPMDYTGLWTFQPEELAVPNPTAETLRFKAVPRTARRLSGVVVDAHSSTPVSEFWVEYRQECLGEWTNGKMKTATDGMFTASCRLNCGMTIKAWNYPTYAPVTLELPPNSCGSFVTIEVEKQRNGQSN